MKSRAVSLDWVLNQLAGMRFPEQGQAYDFIKRSYESGEKEFKEESHNLTLDDEGDFIWDFGFRWLIETAKGNFIWSDPEYQGDNTIRPCKENEAEEWSGRFEGHHCIQDYCGDAVIIKNE